MSDWMEMHALVDGEVAADAKKDAEERLQTCDESRREYEAVLNLKDLLRHKVEPQTCSRTWSKCQGRIRQLEQKQRVERFVTRYAWGLCGGIFCLLIGGAWLNRISGSEVRSGDVAHMVAGAGPISRQDSNSPEELQKWIPANRRKAPQFDFGTLRLFGFGHGRYQGLPYAVIGLVDKDQPLELVVIDGIDRIDGFEAVVPGDRYMSGMMGERNCVSWKDEDYTLILMAQRSTPELVESANQIDLQ